MSVEARRTRERPATSRPTAGEAVGRTRAQPTNSPFKICWAISRIRVRPRIADCWITSKAAGSSRPRCSIRYSLDAGRSRGSRSCRPRDGLWCLDRFDRERIDDRGEFGQDLTATKRLDEIGNDTRFTRALDECALAEGGEQHDHRVTTLDLSRDFDAVETRHLDVQQREVRFEFTDHGERVVAARRLAHHQVTVTLEDLLEVETNDRLVVGYHYTLIHLRPSVSIHARVRRARSSMLALPGNAVSSRRWPRRRGRNSLYSCCWSGVSETSERIRASSRASFQTWTCSSSTLRLSRAAIRRRWRSSKRRCTFGAMDVSVNPGSTERGYPHAPVQQSLGRDETKARGIGRKVAFLPAFAVATTPISLGSPVV